jgi:serine/threonine protein kinase
LSEFDFSQRILRSQRIQKLIVMAVLNDDQGQRLAATRLFPIGTRVSNYTIGEVRCVTHNSFIYGAIAEDKPGKFVFKYIRPEVDQRLITSEEMAHRVLSNCPNAALSISPFICVKGSFGYFMDDYLRGDLRQTLDLYTLTEDQIKRMSFRVLSALEFVHEQRYVHRDIKVENIFLTDGEKRTPLAFLGDFGLATEIPVGAVLSERAGTIPYMAPEMFYENGYDESVDMWAFGVTLFVMRTKVFPFPMPLEKKDGTLDCVSFGKFLFAIRGGKYNRAALGDVGASEAIEDLIKKLLQPMPSKRLTAKLAATHGFYTSTRQRCDAVLRHLIEIPGAFDTAPGT